MMVTGVLEYIYMFSENASKFTSACSLVQLKVMQVYLHEAKPIHRLYCLGLIIELNSAFTLELVCA